MNALQLAHRLDTHNIGLEYGNDIGKEAATMLRSQAARIERLVAALTRISNIDNHITAPIAAEALGETK